MSTGMLQDTAQTTSSASSGSRFRPYASARHQVTKGRYITSNDPRGYIPVYEYPLNGQWIMMDIDDGYILWTGIWKALGNSKADIVKMIESQPNLAPLIRRVRGGYLKIQGTWMPYEVALRLSRRVAWAIRDELIPLFGPNFPSTCLSPDQPGFGQVIPNGQIRRRSRKSAQNPVMQIPPAPSNNNWTVMISNAGHAPLDGLDAEKSSASPQWNFRYSELSMPSPFTKNALTLSPISSVDLYTPLFASHPPSAYRKPIPPTKTGGLSVDTRSLNITECSPNNDELKLPPIQSMGEANPKSPYALPPISAMEDLRGSVTQDAAAVLRRLRMDDDFPRPRAFSEVSSLDRWHSLSHVSSPKSLEWSPRFRPYNRPRSSQDQVRPSMNNEFARYQPSTSYDASRLIWSDTSHEDSASNPSPTSPTTPNSSEHHHSLGGIIRDKAFSRFTRSPLEHWPVEVNGLVDHQRHGVNGRFSESGSFPLRREYQSNAESSHPHGPHRPW